MATRLLECTCWAGEEGVCLNCQTENEIERLTKENEALKEEKEKWGAASLEWNEVVDKQALQIHNLQMDIIGLKNQIKGLYTAIDEGRDEQARLSEDLMEAVDQRREAARRLFDAQMAMEKFADDLESSKYTVLFGQELRTRWKASLNGTP